MVAPIVAGVARAVAGAAKKAPRAKRASDELYNIRRRYKRAAARYEKQAEVAASEADARVFKAAAEQARRQAESLRVENITTERPGSKGRAADIARTVASESKRSLGQLVGKDKSEQAARDRAARAVLSSGMGRQFYASTVELWNKPGIKPKDRNAAIVEGFKKSRLGRQMAKEGREIRDILDVMDILQQHTGVPYLSGAYADEGAAEEHYRLDARRGMLFVRKKIIK